MFSTAGDSPCPYYVPLVRPIATSDFGAASAEYPPVQVCVEISGCGRDVGQAQQAAEVGEFGETVRARDEHACVDGSGDGRADADGGENGDVEDVAHVAGGEGALCLLDHDDAVQVPTSGE